MTTLLGLPPETRNSIYELLLTSSSSDLNVLTASRLLHEEAASYFYQNNAFTVDLPDVATSCATILPPIPDKYLKYSRVLTVKVKLGYVSPADIHKQAQRLTTAANHVNLATLTLNLTSNASRVVSTAIDDCVLHATHPLTLALQHFLSSGVKSVRVNLKGVWFALGLATKLLSEFEGSLEVITCNSSTERALTGQMTRDHLRDLGLDLKDVEDAEYLHSSDYDGNFPSLPSSLSSALSELDTFSPMDHLDGNPEDLQDTTKAEESDSLFDDPMFDMDDVDAGSEEELTEDDDADDEEMEDINDFEAIIDNLQEVTCRKVIKKDICYMTNFAPNML